MNLIKLSSQWLVIYVELTFTSADLVANHFTITISPKMISSTSKKRALEKKKSPPHSIQSSLFSPHSSSKHSNCTLHPIWRTQTQQVSSETNTRIKERGEKKPQCYFIIVIILQVAVWWTQRHASSSLPAATNYSAKVQCQKKKKACQWHNSCSDSSSEPLVQAMDRCKQRAAVVTSHITWGTILMSASWPRTAAAASSRSGGSFPQRKRRKLRTEEAFGWPKVWDSRCFYSNRRIPIPRNMHTLTRGAACAQDGGQKLRNRIL